jgi:hypothetical protein
MSKVDGKFQFSPISVNFLTEVAKVIFAIIMLIIQVSLLSLDTHTLHKSICFEFLGWLPCCVKPPFCIMISGSGKNCKKFLF